MSEPLDPGLFEDVILDGVEPLTVGALLDALDAVGRYWPEGWPVARKLAHIRRRLWTGRNDAGWPWVWSIGWKTRVWSDRDGERGSRLTPEQARALVKQIATSHWQTLDEIRARLKAEGWFPLHATERRQVEALEAILGTEVDSPEPSLDDSENELALVACNWDDLDTPEPQPVYKVREAMTSEDQARERAHLRAWARDFDDVARARQRAFRRGARW